MSNIIDLLPFIFMLLSLGVVAGFLAGLLGVGGGIVLVPGLYYVFMSVQGQTGFDQSLLMHVCVGTSLAIIVPTGFSSALAHHKRGAVDFYLVRAIGAGVILGVIWATYIVRGLEGQVLKMIFASALPLFAALMIFGKRWNKGAHVGEDKGVERANLADRSVGFVIGLLSSLIGIGGATLSVPYMSMRGVAMHRAVGTASALGLVISVPAACGFMLVGLGREGLPIYSVGYVNILAWVCVIPASILIAPLGAKFAHQIAVRPLRIGFACFMVLVSLNMWRSILVG